MGIRKGSLTSWPGVGGQVWRHLSLKTSSTGSKLDSISRRGVPAWRDGHHRSADHQCSIAGSQNQTHDWTEDG